MVRSRSRQRATRRPSLREARADLYRARILDAAELLFAEKGPEATKIEEITEEAGVSQGTLYSVFGGKPSILEALHTTRLRELLHHSIEATRGLEDPLDVLIAGVRGYVAYFLSHPDYLRIHLGEATSWGLPILGASPRAIAWHDGQKTLVETLERGIAEGLFHPDDPSRLARTCAAIGEIRLGDWLVDGMEEDDGEILTDVERQIRRALCRRAEDRDPRPFAE